MSIAILPPESRSSHSPAIGPGTPSKLDERRVLGDLSPNAKIASRTPTAADFRSPKILLETEEKTPKLPPVGLFHTPKLSSRSGPLRTGQKRSIDQVDGPTESPSRGAREVRYRAEDEIKAVQASAFQTPLSSPSIAPITAEEGASDEEKVVPRPKLASQDSSVTQASFSSLIDYNPHGLSSQKEENTVDKEAEETEVPQAQTKAETLRLRLRVAMYKVQTNQINVPLSRLQLRSSPTKSQSSTPAQASPRAVAQPSNYLAEEPNFLRRSSPASPSNSVLARTSTPRPPTTSPLLDSPLKIASTATASHGRSINEARLGFSTAPSSINAPKLLPGPVLKPTAYSSRFIASPLEPSAELSREATIQDGSMRARSSSSASHESRTEIASSASFSSQTMQTENADAETGLSITTDKTGDSPLSIGKDVDMTNGEDTAANGLLELMHAGASAVTSQ